MPTYAPFLPTVIYEWARHHHCKISGREKKFFPPCSEARQMHFWQRFSSRTSYSLLQSLTYSLSQWGEIYSQGRAQPDITSGSGCPGIFKCPDFRFFSFPDSGLLTLLKFKKSPRFSLVFQDGVLMAWFLNPFLAVIFALLLKRGTCKNVLKRFFPYTLTFVLVN